MHRRRRSPDRRLRSYPPKPVVYIRPERPWKNPRPFSFFLLLSCAVQHRRRQPSSAPRPVASPAAVSGAAPVQDRSQHPPLLLLPLFLHQNALKPQATERMPPMVARWRKAVLLSAPSPARASTPWVSARPSSGSVVAPKTDVPHAVAAASSGSSSPARRRVNPHRGGGPADLGFGF
jgi:hypothetical protein